MSRSISEFRSALAALTGPPAPARAVANPRGVRARRNMAIRWGGAEFDTWDEVPEPIKRQILAGQAAAPAAPPRPKAKKVAPAPFTRDLGQAAEEGIVHRIGRGPMYEPGAFMRQVPAEPVRPARQPRAERGERKKASSKQYQDIYAKLAASVGGARHLCPGVDWSATKAQAEASGSTQYAVIFRSMGLSDAGAIAVAQAMDRAGVLSQGTGSYGTTEAQQEQARKILFAVSGISCPVQGKKNPGSASDGADRHRAEIARARRELRQFKDQWASLKEDPNADPEDVRYWRKKASDAQDYLVDLLNEAKRRQYEAGSKYGYERPGVKKNPRRRR